MSSGDALLELLLELQTLDRVPRMGFLLRGVPDPESVTEHTLHVVLLTWVLARRIPGIDTLRAVELALVHDLVEVRTGDLPITAGDYWPEGAKHAAETAAAEELLAPLGSTARDLLQDLAARDSAEWRLVKACDKLQLMLKVTVYEEWGATGLDEFWDHPGNFPDSGLEPLRELFDALRKRRESRRRGA